MPDLFDHGWRQRLPDRKRVDKEQTQLGIQLHCEFRSISGRMERPRGKVDRNSNAFHNGMFRLKYPNRLSHTLMQVTEVPETYHRGWSLNHTDPSSRSSPGLTAVMRTDRFRRYFYEKSTSW